MTNVYKTPAKRSRKVRLFEIGLDVLRSEGWTVERVPGGASVRAIRKGKQRLRVSIRTTQDQWIAFPRQADDKGWVTLSEVDVVLAVSVDDVASPTAARVHWIEAADLRERFDRAYKARLEAGYSVPIGRGVWVPLYAEDDGTPGRAGAGAGLDNPEIAQIPLAAGGTHSSSVSQGNSGSQSRQVDEEPLSIAEAKRRLARTLGVPEANIKITIDA